MFIKMIKLDKIQGSIWEHDDVSHYALGHLIGNQTGGQVMKEVLGHGLFFTL